VLANDCIHLLGSHRLTVLAQVKTLIDYGFLNLHCPNLRIFQEMILEKELHLIGVP
jgi:hypothetical protein